jgi:hypothetical protein
MKPTILEIVAAIIFAFALIHNVLNKVFRTPGAHTAGFSIVKGHFENQAIHPLGLLVAALPPTVVPILGCLPL